MKDLLKTLLRHIFVLGMAAALASCGKSESNLDDAAKAAGVTVAVIGIDLTGVTVQITSDAARRIIIPVGTLFVSNDNGTQNMMAARSVAVEFDGPGSLSTKVEVYCVNRWRAAPTQSSNFSVTMPAEGDPVRKLAECLENKSASHGAKQAAIWMISDDLKNMSFDQVVEKTLDNEEDEIAKLGPDGFADMLEKQNAGLNEEELQVVRSATTEELLELFREKFRPDLEQTVRAGLRDQVDAAGPLLRDCGYTPQNDRLFQASD